MAVKSMRTDKGKLRLSKISTGLIQQAIAYAKLHGVEPTPAEMKQAGKIMRGVSFVSGEPGKRASGA